MNKINFLINMKIVMQAKYSIYRFLYPNLIPFWNVLNNPQLMSNDLKCQSVAAV